MGHEKKMIREKNVKFDGEDGSMEVTDIRMVWIKKPSRMGGLKKFGAIAGAVAGAAVLAGVGHQVGGIGGRVLRGAGRGLGYAAVGLAISNWTQDSFYNKDSDGNTESIAIPIMTVSNAAQSGKRLIVDLKSGGNMDFEFKQKKIIPVVIANLTSAREQGKCPYCGTNAGNVAACPKCGAPIEGGAGAAAGSSGGAGFCTNCGESIDPGDQFCGKCGHRA